MQMVSKHFSSLLNWIETTNFKKLQNFKENGEAKRKE